jgi:hypothetical protein
MLPIKGVTPMAMETGDNFVFIPPTAGEWNRVGIFARGGCHLQTLFACAPLIEKVARGACCIYYDRSPATVRSDLELQTLQGIPEEWAAPVIEKLQLRTDCFQPQLFEPTFRVPGRDDLGDFPKSVVILSIASDAVGRSLYRHRRHGFLVDPGGGWLRSVQSTLNDLSGVAWFRENFERVGQINVSAFVENFARLIGALRGRVGAPVLVFNVLTLEPHNPIHNYQCVKRSDSLRWREFDIALMELSRRLDFPVVDLDRILKRIGIRGQLTAAHFTPKADVLIAREAFRIIKELGIFNERRTAESLPGQRSRP